MRFSNNPIIPGKGVCDPHIHIFGDRAYLYASHDKSSQNETYAMEDWVIWSSEDLVEWTQESVFHPEDTYIGPTNDCWATDAAEKNGRYYYYFSQGTQSTGVAVSSQPGKGFLDARNTPLLTTDLTPTRPYDPSVFVDEDGAAYIVFGTPVWANGDSYYIARLQEDMISLAETPRKLVVNDTADDKPSLHKHNGLYYLSWASHYATAENVYGPYRYRGNTGASNDHGNFFEWNGQWFQSFTIYDPTPYFRAAGLCYVHYRANGEMVTDPLIVEYGVGQYDARWNRISAVWYMKGQGVSQQENVFGGFTLCCNNGGSVLFPRVHHLPQNACISFFICAKKGGCIRIRCQENGELLGECKIPRTGERIDWMFYRVVRCQLHNEAGAANLLLEFEGEGDELFSLDYFCFPGAKDAEN